MTVGVLWQKKDAGVEYQANRWEQRMTVSVSAFGLSAAYARQNTFLYLEESGPVPDELCLAPATLKTTPCPFGFFTETQLPCALLARTQGLYQLQMHDDVAEYIAVVDATDHRPPTAMGRGRVWRARRWCRRLQMRACAAPGRASPTLTSRRSCAHAERTRRFCRLCPAARRVGCVIRRRWCFAAPPAAWR